MPQDTLKDHGAEKRLVNIRIWVAVALMAVCFGFHYETIIMQICWKWFSRKI